MTGTSTGANDPKMSPRPSPRVIKTGSFRKTEKATDRKDTDSIGSMGSDTRSRSGSMSSVDSSDQLLEGRGKFERVGWKLLRRKLGYKLAHGSQWAGPVYPTNFVFCSYEKFWSWSLSCDWSPSTVQLRTFSFVTELNKARSYHWVSSPVTGLSCSYGHGSRQLNNLANLPSHISCIEVTK